MKKYDIFGITQLIEKGLARKLEIVEEAVMKLGAEYEPITVLESFVFLANTKNSQLYRVSYEINESDVKFSNLVQFELDYDMSRFEEETKGIISNIVEAIDRDDEVDTEYYKAKWIDSQRKKKLLESKLDLNVGIKSKYITQTKKIVESAVNSTRGARGVLTKTKKGTTLNTLISEGSVVVETGKPINFSETAQESRKQLVLSKIVEAREAARSLLESPVFTQYVTELYKEDNKETAIEFVAENYQELFTLSLAEQTELFYAICESKLGIKPNLRRIVESLVEISVYAQNSKTISEDISKLHTAIGAGKKNFHQRMQLIEDEVNTYSYTKNDLNILTTVLSDIINQPNEFMAPEFITEAKRLLRKLSMMVESNNIDDAQVAVIVNFISQFYPSQVQALGEEEESEYQKFFATMLAKFGVKSPNELEGEKKKEFFDAVDAGWDSDDKDDDDDDDDDEESDKSKSKGKANYADDSVGIDPATGFPEGSLSNIINGKKKDDEAEETAEEEAAEGEEGPVDESWQSDMVDGDASLEEAPVEQETPIRAVAKQALQKMITGPRKYDVVFARTVANAIARNNARILAKTIEAAVLDYEPSEEGEGEPEVLDLLYTNAKDIIAILIEFDLTNLLRQLKMLKTAIPKSEQYEGINGYIFREIMMQPAMYRNRWDRKTLKQMADAKGINLRNIAAEEV